jgi:hypothetical protein
MNMIETIPHWVAESEWKLSRSPLQTAFQIAYKTPLLAFSWLMEHPELLIPIADHFQVSDYLGRQRASGEFLSSRPGATCLGRVS